MGIVRTVEGRKAELEEFHRGIMRTVPKARKWKEEDDDNYVGRDVVEPAADHESNKLVCVTSGTTLLGLAIVNRLLGRGYSVRITLENQEDLERLTEMDDSENCSRISVVMTQLTKLESLCEAFSGCSGVFHTSSFIDPAGLSGYTKNMADLECNAAEKVMEACARTESVRRCVFTSSLLACVWQANDIHHPDRPRLLDESCWSEETLCRDNKLWLALGKTKAERTAWRVAREADLKLTTVCPALLTSPQSSNRNSSATLAYLKGAKEMFRKRLLATVGVDKAAEAHVRVYEAQEACGRFICYDRVIDQDEDATQLTGTEEGVVSDMSGESQPLFRLSNSKLYNLLYPFSSCSRRHC
ncbi:hypothetical protein H6P81_009907 [Aristolochia fimbriata]|uniref:3-beta hydroxysteroid dehydrogenase/isomerase domain-containing protein n=1 Tax=Aristolochia fimbriata TaxID=158543 RepID=A0AAV7EQJ4_ARIFI|nr:hypothetical protein H6P81_009907 [Aristolochia fimbriata]